MGTPVYVVPIYSLQASLYSRFGGSASTHLQIMTNRFHEDRVNTMEGDGPARGTTHFGALLAVHDLIDQAGQLGKRSLRCLRIAPPALRQRRLSLPLRLRRLRRAAPLLSSRRGGGRGSRRGSPSSRRLHLSRSLRLGRRRRAAALPSSRRLAIRRLRRRVAWIAPLALRSCRCGLRVASVRSVLRLVLRPPSLRCGFRRRRILRRSFRHAPRVSALRIHGQSICGRSNPGQGQYSSTDIRFR